jgi:hypothetical protein
MKPIGQVLLYREMKIFYNREERQIIRNQLRQELNEKLRNLNK